MHDPYSGRPSAARYLQRPTQPPTAPTDHARPPSQPRLVERRRDSATVTLCGRPDDVEIEVALPGLTPDDLQLTAGVRRVRIRSTPESGSEPRPEGIDRTLTFTTPIVPGQAEVTAESESVVITIPKRDSRVA